MTFPSCITIDSRYFRNSHYLGSPVTLETLLPNSLTKSLQHSPHAPIVSKVSGTKQCVWLNAAYFDDLDASALLAADPALREESGTCNGAKVSGIVTSHAEAAPIDIRVMPSGRLTSDRPRPTGSFVDGIWARCKARHTMSLSSLYLGRRPALFLQARP